MCNAENIFDSFKLNPALSAIYAENKAKFVDGCAYAVSLQDQANQWPLLFGITKISLEDVFLYLNPEIIKAAITVRNSQKVDFHLELGKTFFYTLQDAEQFILSALQEKENKILGLKNRLKNQVEQLKK